MGLSFGLLVVSVTVAAAVVSVAVPRVGAPGSAMSFLRFAAVSGVCAVGSSTMYFIHNAGGGISALIMGDALMVLAPALMYVAVRALEGRRVRGALSYALALASVVATVTALVPLPASLAVKALALSVACGVGALAAWRSRISPAAPMRVIVAVNLVYSLYSAARIVVGIGMGWHSPLFLAAFSFVPTTVLGALAVMSIGGAVLRLRLEPRVTETASGRPPGVAVVLGDWDLASAAYGTERMGRLLAEMRTVARAIDPDAKDIPHGVMLSAPDAVNAISERVRTNHRWKPDEAVLLVDGASTAHSDLPRSDADG
ncbi:hypothetical protein [Microbacterium sp. lyk4-40-TSB-66]|uniref:hypothetical protein n=1 Tax=Microbacterium sp. lyk4-40-TSB-66 TaxID=3040294 RepID=UPI00254CBC75|nr:hypothetical protein [Microbacterium sp. lyk4-40-TSB-66]